MLKKIITLSAGLFFSHSLLLLPNALQAATQHHRLIWDSDPSSSAVIGFSPDGSSNAPYVNFGYTTNESQWLRQDVSNTQTFAGSLTSHFVRLKDLPADSAVYYRVCDQNGCGQRFWFKTAPTDNSSFIAVAGGDTRTGWSTRRDGNRLIAKLRPLFIMHGGDFTDANSVSQMKQYLSDWALTFSSDTINGVSYKRIYPFIPTHGNHEDNDFRTLCRVFGVDFNQDGNCSNSDTYGAFNISPLLRVYTLNSQYRNSGWSSYAASMNNWLTSDLSSYGNSATWRFAQYHKPMFPHYTGKSDSTTLHQWWANTFYDYSLNLVVESDTHVTKLTQPVIPSGSNFTATTTGGTVYVGEGSWGAPARAANDAKSWTLDMASIQQFKVITVTPEELEVRTAQFNSGAATLSRSQRESDSTALPANVNWWSARGLGEVLRLRQSAGGRSVIVNEPTGGGDSVSVNASDDTFIASARSSSNFDGSAEQLLADNSDSSYGTMMAMVKFDLSSIQSCVRITAASVVLNVFNRSTGNYGIYEAGASNWNAATATWNSVGGNAIKGAQLASFNPSTSGIHSVALNTTGLNKVNNWLQGNNRGFVIASTGTADGIDISAMESGNGPTLNLLIDKSACNGGGATETVTIYENRDTSIASKQATSNLNSGLGDVEADGYDSQYGQLLALLGFPVLEQVPACASLAEANLILNIKDKSNGRYEVYSASSDWSANTVTWNSAGGENIKGSFLGDFYPNSLGSHTYTLNNAAKTVIEEWLDGRNRGIVIASAGTQDGIIMEDGGSSRARLQISFTRESCTP